MPALAAWTPKQDKVHEIAQIARSIGLPESDPIIKRAQEIWWEEHDRVQEEVVMVEQPKTYNLAQKDINAIARTIWGEAGGIQSKAEQAAVAWCILNRVDAGYASSIIGVITAPNQFVGYKSTHPLKADLVELAKDVLTRWYREKDGETNVGRTLPSDYFYFHGRNGHNWFRKEFRSTSYWDWSLPDPYK